MVIFVMNCYKNLEGVGVIALLLCSRDFLNVSFLAITSRLSI